MKMLLLVCSCLVMACGVLGTVSTHNDPLGRQVTTLSGMEIPETRPKGGALKVRLERIEGTPDIHMTAVFTFAGYADDESAWWWEDREIRWLDPEGVMVRGPIVHSGRIHPSGLSIEETVQTRIPRDKLDGVLVSDVVKVMVCEPQATGIMTFMDGLVGCHAFRLDDDQVEQVRGFLR